MPQPRGVDEAIARFDELIARYDGQSPAAVGAARRRYTRDLKTIGKRVFNMGVALGILIVATIGFGLIVGPIGWTGLFIVAVLALFLMIFFTIWPPDPDRLAYSEQLPTRTIVQQLDSYLVQQRRALPAPAVQYVDAISSQLPLLEAKLDRMNALDPLAQDARRLMGKHLPELIDRYERVPPVMRQERDAGGLTVDERLIAGLDAARDAIDDLSAKLTHGDLDAFETQGRFLESRYKDEAGFKGE